MKNIILAISDIVTAFSAMAVGTRILDTVGFMSAVRLAIDSHDFSSDRVPGQGFIMCPEAIPFVSGGIGKRTANPEDYVARLYRGVVELFLKRELAAPLEGLAVVVYTREAYLADPEVAGSPEGDRIRSGDATHVLVAVISMAGPKAPLTPTRFVSNLAGGNNEALQWSADEIRQKAGEVKDYWSTWAVVAD